MKNVCVCIQDFLILECQKINLKSKLCQLQRRNRSKGKKMELMNDDKKNEYRMKENKRRLELRRKQLSKMNEEDLIKYRKKRLWKKKKAKVLLEQSLSSSTASVISTISDKRPYRNQQLSRKAIKKGIEALPFSPWKRQAVIRSLASRVVLKLEMLKSCSSLL